MKHLIWCGVVLALLLSAMPATPALAQYQVQPPMFEYDSVLTNYGSGLCLQPERAARINGLAIVQQPCVGNDAYQRWFFSVLRLDYQKPGIYWVINSGSGQCLDDRDGRTADGSPVPTVDVQLHQHHDAVEIGERRIQPGIATRSALGAVH